MLCLVRGFQVNGKKNRGVPLTNSGAFARPVTGWSKVKSSARDTCNREDPANFVGFRRKLQKHARRKGCT